MASFALVKDQHGVVRGVWVQNAADASDDAYLITLFLREGLPPEAIAGTRRVVPNRVDSRGGCFVMLGSSSAPGE